MGTKEFLVNGIYNNGEHSMKLLDCFPTLDKAKQFIKTHNNDCFQFYNIIEYKYGFKKIHEINELFVLVS